MTPHEILRCAARRLIVLEVADLDVRLVYLVRRVSASELLDQGLAEIPGAVEAAHAASKRWEDSDRQALLNDCKTAKQRAELRAKWEAEDAEAGREALAALTSSPEQVKALMDRFDAYICASVEAAGVARDGVAPGLLPVGTEPPDVCVDLGDGKYVQPLRFVRGTPSGPQEMALTELSDADRMVLATAIAASYQGVATRAETFRGAAGDARADGRVGAPVRPAPERPARAAGGKGARRAAGARGRDAG